MDIFKQQTMEAVEALLDISPAVTAHRWMETPTATAALLYVEWDVPVEQPAKRPRKPRGPDKAPRKRRGVRADMSEEEFQAGEPSDEE